MSKVELAKEIRRRVEGGESKRAIFAELSPGNSPDLVARILGAIATPTLRVRYAGLNRVLVVLMLLTAGIKVLGALTLIGGLPPAAQIPALLFIPAFNLLFVWEILRFRGGVYRVYGLLAIGGLLKSIDPNRPPAGELEWAIFLAFAAVIGGSIGLAFYLGAKLFPDLGLFKPRMDASGKYQITD